MLFTGNYEHTIDSKQRLAIPANFRALWRPEEHGAAWCAVPWPGCLIRLYTEREFGIRAKSLEAGLTPDPDLAELSATLFGLTSRIEPDTTGRIRLPEDLLTLVGMPSEVVLVGAGQWLEIRDRAQWRQSRATRLEQLPDLMARLDAKRARSE